MMVDPADVPEGGDACNVAMCTGGVPSFAHPGPMTPCGMPGQFCNGNGGCPLPTCMDGMKNGVETDVDCGGPVCTKCGSNQMCMSNLDCVSNVCGGNGRCS